MNTASNSTKMAAAEPLPTKTSLKLAELRNRVLIGELAADFLRIPITPANSSTATGANGQIVTAQPPQQQMVVPGAPQPFAYVNPANLEPEFERQTHFYSFVPPHTRGRIAVKIVEAKLTKNYGLPGVRMDPYVRVRIGNTLFETPTCVNGGKSPHWNRTVNAYLPDGVESIYLQIYDERAFTSDECVAWAHVMLPHGIFSQETIDEWYQLSGPQGEGKEGVVNLVISFTPVPQQQQQPAQVPAASRQGGDDQTIAAAAAQMPFSEADLDELQEMFPTIDKEVIRTVLEANRGAKDPTVNALIEMAN
uniref:CUE domain-containing protein n=1 Tax=Globodera pallida TaxID=36090 RepID=A0A183CBV7_GLOPA